MTHDNCVSDEVISGVKCTLRLSSVHSRNISTVLVEPFHLHNLGFHMRSRYGAGRWDATAVAAGLWCGAAAKGSQSLHAQ